MQWIFYVTRLSGNGPGTLALEELTINESPDTKLQGQEETEVNPVLEQLVTHIPDLIAYRVHDAPLPQTIHSYGVVMFADISGIYFIMAQTYDCH